MPLETDYLAPSKVNISVALEPVPNALNSFMMLTRVEELSGLGEWVTRMAATLPPERLHINQLVFIGMHPALQPDGAGQASQPTSITWLRCPPKRYATG